MIIAATACVVKMSIVKSVLIEVLTKYKNDLLLVDGQLKPSSDEVFFRIESDLLMKMSRKHIYLSIKRNSMEIFGKEIMKISVVKADDGEEDDYGRIECDETFFIDVDEEELSPVEVKFRGRVRQTPPQFWTDKLARLLWTASNKTMVCCITYKSGSYSCGEFVAKGKS